jgi:hypothetical protein
LEKVKKIIFFQNFEKIVKKQLKKNFQALFYVTGPNIRNFERKVKKKGERFSVTRFYFL